MREFVKEEANGLIVIKCPFTLDGDAIPAFNDLSKSWLLSTSPIFVLDLTHVRTLGRAFYASLIQMRTILKRDSKTLYTINISEHHSRQIINDGMEHMFQPVNSLDEVINKGKQPKQKPGLNAEFVNPFLMSTLKTFQIQCNTNVKPLKPYLKTNSLPNIAIAGIITINSSSYTGSIVLCFSESVFLKIYQNMFDEKLESITPEAQDAAGELLNIIYGMVKTDLNQKGYDFQKALPTVLVAEQLTIRQSGNTPAVVVPFDTGDGQFHIEFEFNKGA